MATQAQRADVFDVFAAYGLSTRAEAMRSVLERSLRIANVSDLPLLIEGETGTGKSALANIIHALDPRRRTHAFVVVSCASLTESLADSELFGHRRGAFSGARMDRTGLFLTAHRGTIFFDDVDCLPVALQAKLLDVLQRGRLRAIGSDRESGVDVRVMAAANRPVAELIRQGLFRLDLYHRLNVVHLTLPPLRERPGDVRLLAAQFVARHRQLYDAAGGIDSALMARLEQRPWPGNVRELEHLVQRMLLCMRQGDRLGLEELAEAELVDGDTASSRSSALRSAAANCFAEIHAGRASFEDILAAFQSELLQQALEASTTRSEVARLLSISERALYYKLRLFHLT